MGEETENLSLVIQQKMTAWVNYSETEPTLRLTPFGETIEQIIEYDDIEQEAVWIDVAGPFDSYDAADNFIKNRQQAGNYRVSAFKERILTEIPQTSSFKLS